MTYYLAKENCHLSLQNKLARTIDSEYIRILDPGCGSAILSCSLIEHLVKNTTLKRIVLDLYDTDTVLIPYTEIVLEYLRDWLCLKGQSGISFAQTNGEMFIAGTVKILK